jgi:glucose-6-phosphate 1-epimerase
MDIALKSVMINKNITQFDEKVTMHHQISTQRHPQHGLMYLDIKTPYSHSIIFFQGAQITHFQPKDGPPLLWLSPTEAFVQGKGCRGGIPICWPWFGTHPAPNYPQHGFVRHQLWTLDEIEEQPDAVVVRMRYPSKLLLKEFWPHATELYVTFTLGKSLHMQITTTNLGHSAIEFTQALHSYFAIPDIDALRVRGLNQTPYIEFGQAAVQTEPDVHITREIDRMYHDTVPLQQLQTAQGSLFIERENSHSCVLWNPWIDKARQLTCFEDDDYQRMVCLETCNILNDRVQLAPNQSHTLSHHIYWEASTT